MSTALSQPATALGEDYVPQGFANYTKVPGEKQLYERGAAFYIRQKLSGGKDKWVELESAPSLREARYERDLRSNERSVRFVQKRVKCDEAFEAIVAMRTSETVRAEERWTEQTVRSHRTRWTKFCSPIIGRTDVDRVTTEQLTAIYSGMKKATYVRGGVERHYSEGYIGDVEDTLSGFFTTAMADPFNYCTENPVPLVGFYRPSGNTDREVGLWAIISPDEAERLFAGCHHRLQSSHVTEAIMRVAYGTGGRLGEILGLTWDDDVIDLREGSVTFTRQLHFHARLKDDPSTWLRPLKGKADQVGGAVRNVPLFDDTLAFMRGYREWLISMGLYQRGGWVFPSLPHKTPRLPNSAQECFYAAVKRAGIERREGENLHFHCLRHSYASNLFAAGFSLAEVSEFLGHTSTEVTRKHYVRVYNVATRNQSARERMRVAQGGAR